MDILEIILAVTSCFLLCIFLFLLMIFSARDSSYKSQEETKEIKKEMKHVVPDVEYNKLVEQYGSAVVLMAELEYNKLILDLNGKENISISFADECELQNEKLKEQEAEIKRIKSLSKEELELYLLQEEAIKQIKSK